MAVTPLARLDTWTGTLRLGAAPTISTYVLPGLLKEFRSRYPGLDVSVRTGILNLLLDLREAMGMAQLFITHDLAVAKHLCDRVAVMHRGRIVEEGPAAQVMSSPTHAYTRELLAAVPENRLPQTHGLT